MTHALNLTLPLKQDAESQQALTHLAEIFTEQVQPEIDVALRKSRRVHFARVVVIDNKYIQVITEYEGSHEEYTEFFRRELTDVFAAIFALADTQINVGDPTAFWEFSAAHNIRSLGQSVDGSTTLDGKPAGYLFSAYGGRTVKQVQDGLGIVIAEEESGSSG